MSSPKTSTPHRRLATLIVVPTKQDISHCLEQELLRLDRQHTIQHVALSGGSLPSFLQPVMMHHPEFSQTWHVYLADERCVPSTHPDSNLGALLRDCLSHVPSARIHGINESLLHDPEACARDYEQVLHQQHLPGGLDLALLGFGEDGHTCSLFPNHALLTEQSHRVAAITDSPKPPRQRITLTMKALAEIQHVVFTGAGTSKAPVLQQIFVEAEKAQWTETEGGIRRAVVEMKDPPPLPCGAVSPRHNLLWIVDAEAFPIA